MQRELTHAPLAEGMS